MENRMSAVLRNHQGGSVLQSSVPLMHKNRLRKTINPDTPPDETEDVLLKNEDMAESTPESPEEPISTEETPANFLATYFRDMSHLAILRPEQEIAMAKQLHDQEIERWAQFLRVVPFGLQLHELLKERLFTRNPEWISWQRSVQEPTEERDVSIIQALAVELYTHDLDRIWIHEVWAAWLQFLKQSPLMGEMKKVAAGVSMAYRRAEQLKNAFVQANLRLVVSIARRFYQGRMPLADLIQEGNIGLIKAVERFDYHKGYRFSTYASWWIRHAISRALADKGRSVRVPVHMIDTYHRLVRSKRELTQQLGHPPTDEELSHATGVSIEKIEKMNGYLLEYSFSIDQSVSDQDRRQFVDMIEDDSPTVQPMVQLMDRDINHGLDELMNALSPMEADILRQRFGIDSEDEEEHTLKEIGKKYHLSRERIRQIQEHALTKIRQGLAQKELI